ncbi:MAG: FG-GAP repeat protein [Planctomycetes bacterium]|nr:FG-GAP repeat protein [Planctomycetota bacterium]
MLRRKSIIARFTSSCAILGCVSTSLAIEPCELARLTPSDLPDFGSFGRSVAVGDYIVVGAPGHSFQAPAAGAAYIYERVGTSWIEQARLFSPEPFIRQKFGTSVATEGDRIVIGANAFDIFGFAGIGAVYVYGRIDPPDCCADCRAPHEAPGCEDEACEARVCRDIPTCCTSRWDLICALLAEAACDPAPVPWKLEAELSAPQPHFNDNFGFSVALSGPLLVVGVPGIVAYIFRLQGEAWVLEAELEGSGAFGAVVAVGADTAVVSAHRSDLFGENAGAVYVFTHDGTSWTQQAILVASDTEPNDRFGTSVALHGDTIAIGALNSGLNGAAYIFRKIDGNWVEETKLEETGGDSVALGLDLLVVGSSRQDPGGAAFVFRRVDSAWVQQSVLVGSETAPGGEFGFATALNGGLSVVGPDREGAFVFAVDDDCNDNGVADLCDIRDGTSSDLDGNTVPDECVTPPVIGPVPAVSAWGITTMILLLLVCGKLRFRRRAADRSAGVGNRIGVGHFSEHR